MQPLRESQGYPAPPPLQPILTSDDLNELLNRTVELKVVPTKSVQIFVNPKIGKIASILEAALLRQDLKSVVYGCLDVIWNKITIDELGALVNTNPHMEFLQWIKALREADATGCLEGHLLKIGLKTYDDSLLSHIDQLHLVCPVYLNLLECAGLTDEILCQLIDRLPHLEHLELDGEGITSIKAIERLKTVNWKDSSALKELRSPIASGARITLSPLLKVIELTVAKVIFCPECPSLETIIAPNAQKIEASRCSKLNYLIAPDLIDLDVGGCSDLQNLHVPKIKRLICSDCPKILYLSLPLAKFVDITGCRPDLNIEIPNECQLVSETTIRIHFESDSLISERSAIINDFKYVLSSEVVSGPTWKDVRVNDLPRILCEDLENGQKKVAGCLEAAWNQITHEDLARLVHDYPHLKPLQSVLLLRNEGVSAELDKGLLQVLLTSRSDDCFFHLNELCKICPVMLDLDLYNHIQDSVLDNILNQLPDLKHLSVKGLKKITRLIGADKFETIWCSGASSLTELYAPSAKDIDCSDTSITELFAPMVKELNCSDTSVRWLNLPIATRVTCNNCHNLENLVVPTVQNLHCQSCPKINSLVLPEAKFVNCAGCSSTLKISVPETCFVSDAGGKITIQYLTQ